MPMNRLVEGRPFFPYAYVMLVRICVTLARRARVRRMRELPAEVAGRVAPPWRRAVEREAREHLRRALRMLTQEDRAMIADRYWRMASTKRMGDRRGLEASVVQGRLHRARKKLRALLPNDVVAPFE
jgi:RNA polymerase sigma factor (sigma-70 family)